MDRKAIIGIVVTFIVTLVLSQLWARVERGGDAQTEDAIRKVLNEEMQIVVDGETKTFKEAFSTVYTKVVVMEATVGALIEE